MYARNFYTGAFKAEAIRIDSETIQVRMIHPKKYNIPEIRCLVTLHKRLPRQRGNDSWHARQVVKCIPGYDIRTALLNACVQEGKYSAECLDKVQRMRYTAMWAAEELENWEQIRNPILKWDWVRRLQVWFLKIKHDVKHTPWNIKWWYHNKLHEDYYDAFFTKYMAKIAVLGVYLNKKYPKGEATTMVIGYAKELMRREGLKFYLLRMQIHPVTSVQLRKLRLKYCREKETQHGG